MTMNSITRLTIGGLLILTALFGVSLIHFPTDETHSSLALDVARLHTTTQETRGTTTEVVTELHSVFELDVPTRMRVTESKPVRLRVNGYAVRSETDAETGEELRVARADSGVELDRFGKLQLNGAGFDIGPSEALDKPEGTRLPTTYAWTVQPKTADDHTLILDMSGFLAPLEDGEQLEWSLSRADDERDVPQVELLDEARLLTFPVEVLTRQGLSREADFILRGLLALFGFVVMYPVVTEWVKRWALPSGGEPSGESPGEAESEKPSP